MSGNKKQDLSNKFEALFEQSPALMALWQGPTFIYEKVNPQYQAMFGKRVLVGKPILEALPELKGQPFINLLTHVWKTGESYIANEMKAPPGDRR